MRVFSSLILFTAILQATLGPASAQSPSSNAVPAGKVAAKPLFRDPVFDGAADAVVIWNRQENKWFMFYTNRRANLPDDQITQVTWVHGTKIGIAESSDGGATWKYRGTADIDYGEKDCTQWAPEVIENNGVYHMFLTIVPGIFNDWQHPRDIIHLTSSDLLKWKYESTLKLGSDRVIDPCVYRLPNGGWRMWYNNERDGKSIYYADSPDLFTWEDKGKVTGVGERPGEGPYVFRWKNRYWMLVDVWRGLGVYSSDDLTTWKVQPTNILGVPGKGPDDTANGGHPGVVVSGDRAYCFYFTHPGRMGTLSVTNTGGYARRRSSIQVVELEFKDGQITCDRDKPTYIDLQPPRAGLQAGAFGNDPLRVHDPSTIIKCKDEYWVFSTGRGVLSWHSKDLAHWERGPAVFSSPPAWVTNVVANQRGSFWAPDVIQHDGRYLLYYSVSAFGKRTSAIALASNPTLDPSDPNYHWTDQGIVIQTDESNDYNAIDPCVVSGENGALWLSFGSFWSGIKLLQLDPATGKQMAPDSRIYPVAHRKDIEASAIYRHDGNYYLFVDWGYCCRGTNSTYNIRVGRSRDITGPYVDKDGVDLMQGGGSLVLDTEGPFIGPGHAGILKDGDRYWMSFHFYDGTQNGRARLAVRPLQWAGDGWPQVLSGQAHLLERQQQPSKEKP